MPSRSFAKESGCKSQLKLARQPRLFFPIQEAAARDPLNGFGKPLDAAAVLQSADQAAASSSRERFTYREIVVAGEGVPRFNSGDDLGITVCRRRRHHFQKTRGPPRLAAAAAAPQ